MAVCAWLFKHLQQQINEILPEDKIGVKSTCLRMSGNNMLCFKGLSKILCDSDYERLCSSLTISIIVHSSIIVIPAVFPSHTVPAKNTSSQTSLCSFSSWKNKDRHQHTYNCQNPDLHYQACFNYPEFLSQLEIQIKSVELTLIFIDITIDCSFASLCIDADCHKLLVIIDIMSVQTLTLLLFDGITGNYFILLTDLEHIRTSISVSVFQMDRNYTWLS